MAGACRHVILELTNQWHGLIWTGLELTSTPFGDTLIREHGILGWLNAFYTYALILIAFGLILQAAFRTLKKNRLRGSLLVLGTFLALMGSASSFFGRGLWGYLDMTPLFFPVMGVIFAWGIFDQHMFDLVPVARDTFVRSMGQGLLVLDEEGTLADINPAALRMLDARAKPAWLSAEAALARWPQLADCWQGPAETSAELRLDRPEGLRWVDARSSFLYDSKGAYHGRVIALWDITGRKQVEESLRQNEANLVMAQRIASVGSYTWDLIHDRLACSDEFYRILGVARDEDMTYEAFLARVHPEDRERFDKRVREAAGQAVTFNMDYRIVRPDGIVRMIHGEGETILDSAGKPGQVIGTIQDLTERMCAEDALKDAKARAELYLDLMSHDIRNMNMVGKGFLELALELPDNDPKKGEYMLKSMGSLEKSTRLIENVGNIQKALSAESKLYEIDACKTMAQVIAYYSNVPDANVTFHCDMPAECMVVANDFLYDIFGNIAGNAIKHGGPVPVITVRIDRASSGDRTFARFTFEDCGPGIPDDMKEDVFERLRRGHTMANGRGLGLYLVKSLVDNYQGRVWVENRIAGDYTQGSRFVILLPAVEK